MIPKSAAGRAEFPQMRGKSAAFLSREGGRPNRPPSVFTALCGQTAHRKKSKQEVPNMRVKITLACTECKRRNYVSKKNKKNDPDRIEMMKHCRFCNKHTLHKETK